MRRLYILSVVGIGLLATVLVSVAMFSPETYDDILDSDRIEVVSVEWTEEVDVPHDPEIVRWLNFTVFNHGENATPQNPTGVKLEVYDNDDYRPIDQRTMILKHGINNLILRASATLSKYRLFVDENKIWEGTVPQ